MGYQNPNLPEGWQNQPLGAPGKGAQQIEKSVEQIANSALERVQKVREEAQTGLTEQLEQTADRIRRVGQALTTTSDQIRGQDRFIAGYLDRASHSAERVADYVRSANFADVADDIRRFARERPAWFYGGAFVLGLSAGRFLRSSPTSSADAERATDPSFAFAKGRATQDVPHSAPLTAFEPPRSSAPHVGTSSTAQPTTPSGSSTASSQSSSPSGASSSPSTPKTGPTGTLTGSPSLPNKGGTRTS